jgi:pimeloyl-ACP methyl ester carboxylesterase
MAERAGHRLALGSILTSHLTRKLITREVSMKGIQRFSKTLQSVVLAGIVLASTLGAATTAAAQDLKDIQTSKPPLLLKAQGSFFVGGESVVETDDALGFPGTGHITINQMYVEYVVPQPELGVPVVMLHGGTLSGKSYQTTPDGRMGWNEYFVRQGHAVYLPDQVSRARSGFDQGVFNKVQAGTAQPSALPVIIRASNESEWPVFRFGPTFGSPWPDEQFPVSAIDKFAKQGIPDLNGLLPTPDPNFKALSDLAIQANGAVVMGHSESGNWPLEAALTNSTGTKGLILLEPLGCNATTYTDQQIAKLATVPILIEFGDHLDTPTPLFDWPAAVANCKAFIARVNAAHGNAQLLYPPDLGIHGNSHMVMLDKNNLQIADLILKWIDTNVGKNKVAKK